MNIGWDMERWVMDWEIKFKIQYFFRRDLKSNPLFGYAGLGLGLKCVPRMLSPSIYSISSPVLPQALTNGCKRAAAPSTFHPAACARGEQQLQPAACVARLPARGGSGGPCCLRCSSSSSGDTWDPRVVVIFNLWPSLCIQQECTQESLALELPLA